MFDWIWRRKSRIEIPEYSEVRKTPNRGLPSDLAEAEQGQAFLDHCEEIERSLREAPRRPHPERPLFVELLAADQRGVVTMTLPETGALCLPIFTSPLRAADYSNTLLASGPPVGFLSSSPLQLIAMLRDLRGIGIEQFALDRCPRCNIFTAIRSESVTTGDDAINCWCIWKATKLARLDLYLKYARECALASNLHAAREVVFETVAHVSLEDPRAHFLLGQIAVALADRPLLGEVRGFLQFLQLDSWERRLDEVIRSGSSDFDLADY